MLTLTLTGCARPLSNESTTAETGTQSLTIGQPADYLIKAADDYNPNTDRASVLESFSETEQATQLQMFVLASRAFGNLPTCTGNGGNTAPPAVHLTGAPEWSRRALRNLSNGGMLAASDLGLSVLDAAFRCGEAGHAVRG